MQRAARAGARLIVRDERDAGRGGSRRVELDRVDERRQERGYVVVQGGSGHRVVHDERKVLRRRAATRRWGIAAALARHFGREGGWQCR